MGLGKTLQALALIVVNSRSDEEEDLDDEADDDLDRTNADDFITSGIQILFSHSCDKSAELFFLLTLLFVHARAFFDHLSCWCHQCLARANRNPCPESSSSSSSWKRDGSNQDSS